MAGPARKPKRRYTVEAGKRSHRESDEIKALEAAIKVGAPDPGTNPLATPAAATSSAAAKGGSEQLVNYSAARTFDELPMSAYTKDALRLAKYITLTAIQRAALPHALAGRDVLGAAKTGSGKTLAFLVPMVEKLYRMKWTRMDGLGGLVLTPTRELAMQIFEELRKVGKQHDLSAGLLIGGKDVKEEKNALSQMNILVATPGRLLQHMDETAGFECTQLQVLVLDEADRILDMGFSASLDAILKNLPSEGRQTLLFSATQTKCVRDLARLSLVDPEYLAVHAEASVPTPLKLQQAYLVVPAHDKMDVLWSFFKAHLQCKTLVFVSTCKQVRFVLEAMRKLRPGVPLRGLHGNMKQPRRMTTFYEFSQAKAMVLVATDIAARGLDFTKVDWVVQADCPEDVPAYIHRVGRTARYMSSGRALLLLTPGERDGMLALLTDAGVPLKQIKQNPAKIQRVTPALQALLSKDTELKDFAQRALVAYLRSVFLQPAKQVFDVTSLRIPELAQSWGLLAAPKLRFLKRVGRKVTAVEVGGNASAQLVGDADEDEAAAAAPAAPGPPPLLAGTLRRSAEAVAAAEGLAASRSGGEASTSQPAAAAAGGKKARDRHAVATGPAAVPLKSKGAAAAGGSGFGAGGSDDEEDDFLVVKKRHDVKTGSESDDEGVAEGMADIAAAAAVRKKKKKQKIAVGRSSGTRVVFDEEGNEVEPLALLAAGFENDDGTPMLPGPPGAGVGRGSRGMNVVREVAAERFAEARGIMRARDSEDKARLKALKKAALMKKKDNKRRREEDASDDSDEEGGVRVTLGGPDSGSDSGDDGRRPSNSGSDDDDGPSNTAYEPAPPRPEKAHLGMGRKAPAAAAGAGSGGGSGAAVVGGRQVPPQPGLRGNGTADMSVAAQEALALRMLGVRKKT